MSDIPVITKILLPKGIPNSASSLLFTPETTKLIQYSENKFYIVKCDEEETEVESAIEEDEGTA